MNAKLLAMSVALWILPGVGETFYVDDDNYGKSGDGTSAAKAYGTIQEAVDAAANGDTVKVLPGTYDRGGYDDGFTSNRVHVSGKQLFIESTGGRDVTFIVGHHSVASSGFGTDAVRCVYIDNNTATVGTEIRGFTLKDGGVVVDSGTVDTRFSQGGGLYAGRIGEVFLIDCAIFNCWARAGGGMLGGGAIRCLFAGNVKKGGANGAIARSAYLLNCICVNNVLGGQPALQGSQAVNCTFVGNGETGNLFSENSRARNCLSVLNAQNLAGVNSQMGDVRNTVCATPASYDTSTTAADKQIGFVGDADPIQLFAPALGDYRPIRGSLAATHGDAALLDREVTTLKVPIDEVYFDFYTNAIPQTGTIAVGAVQEIAPEPTSGGVLFLKNTFLTFGYANLGDRTYAYPKTYPSQFHFEKTQYVNGQSDIFAYWIHSNASANRRAPEMDDSFFLMPPPTVGSFVTNDVLAATQVFYVNKASGNNGNAGTSSAPFKSISHACESSSENRRTVIYVAAGDYDEATEGGTVAYSHTNRVVVPANRNIRIKGAGKTVTTIRGKANPETLGNDAKYGMSYCGPAAARCVVALGNMILQGFTLADGHSRDYDSELTGNARTESRTGGAVYCAGNESIIADSIITNAVCGRGICYLGNYARVEFRDCYGYNGGMRACRSFSSCLMTGTTGSGAGCVFYNDNKIVCHCSTKGTALNTSVWDGSNAATWNSVFLTGKSLNSSATEEKALATQFGNFVYDWLTMPTYACYTYADPDYASARDLRPRYGSPLFGGGVKPTVDNYGTEYWQWITSDIDGRAIVFDAAGRPTAGCYQRGVSTVTVNAPRVGTVTPSGTVIVEDGASVTVTYTPDSDHATRPYFGIAVDGETATAGTSCSVAVPAAGSAIAGRTVDVLSATNWYVNANAEDDSGNGWTPETAKKTLAAIMSCDILSGDCVHAAAGDYASGLLYTAGTATTSLGITSNRVVVTDGVTLVGDSGAAETRILGANGSNTNAFGRGTGAVRCVMMCGASVLKGFTLQNGNTSTDNETGPSVDRDGGGVYSEGGTAQIRDCVITGCAANRGGGAMNGTYVNCRFTDNASVGDGQGDASRSVSYYGCYIGRQRSSNGSQGVIVAENTTFDDSGANNLATSCAFRNCLFRNTSGDKLYVRPSDATSAPKLYNCLFDAEHYVTWTNYLVNAKTVLDRCETEPLVNLQLDANGVPVKGACAAIDAGDATLLADASRYAGVDALGKPRILNGALDIGAMEYDWRTDYAAALGKGVTVTTASENVRLVDGKVALSDGDTLSGSWPTASETRRARYSVTASAGAGTLTGALVAAGKVDERFALTAAAETRRFKALAADIDFAFAYEGEGTGILSSFVQDVPGLLLLVR